MGQWMAFLFSWECLRLHSYQELCILANLFWFLSLSDSEAHREDLSQL